MAPWSGEQVWTRPRLQPSSNINDYIGYDHPRYRLRFFDSRRSASAGSECGLGWSFRRRRYTDHLRTARFGDALDQVHDGGVGRLYDHVADSDDSHRAYGRRWQFGDSRRRETESIATATAAERSGSRNTGEEVTISSPKWWNWQTHHLEGVAPRGVRVRIPPSAFTMSRSIQPRYTL